MRFVGEGSLRDELLRLSLSLGLGESVEFLGTRTDVPELLGAADLFVLSTTPQEGLGTVMIEAMAAGLAVVASDVPACRELLYNGQYGVLVPPSSPDHLAAAIIATFNQPPIDLQQRTAYAMKFTPERMIEQYLSIVGQ